MSLRIYLIIIFFLVAGFLGYFLVWPAYQEMANTQLEIEEIKVSIQKGEEYYAGLEALSKKMEEYGDQISILNSALPQKVYIPHFYDFFPEISSRHGLLFQGLTCDLGSSEEGAGIKEIPISLNVTGSYDSFESLLAYLESSVRFFSIESISLNADQEGELFSANLSIKTHSY